MSIFEELPKPAIRQESGLADPSAQLQFAEILNGFALFYHLLHKFLIPLFMIYSWALPTPCIEKVDWWWLYHAYLAYLFYKRRTECLFFRGVLAFGLAGAILQFLESFAGKSWHNFSLWLTATTTFVVVWYSFRIVKPLPLWPQGKMLILGFMLGLCVEGIRFAGVSS